MGRKVYTAEQFIKAIPGTGGIISAIARTVGCEWSTAHKYIHTHPTVAKAYKDEQESVLDVAESVVVMNIQYARKKQRDTAEPVDAADAKWMLSRKGKDRGYSDKQEIEHSGETTVRLKAPDLSNLSDEELDTLARLADRLAPDSTGTGET